MKPRCLVLHVEDDRSILGSVQALLASAGHVSVPVPSAEGALSWMDQRPADPDVLVIDFELPGEMQGTDVAQEVCRRLGRGLPTIVLSGRLTDVDALWMPGSPVLCVWKPVDPELLLKAVETFASFGRFARARLRARRGGGAPASAR